MVVLACVSALVGLGACTERPQEQGTRSAGAPSSAGTGSQFVAQGWKPGDAASWDEHIRSRAMYGQNEYSRSTSSQ
jgi:hypothetical protein